MLAGPTGFSADPREQPQWCNTSAGPLENPMTQCLPPPYPAAEDMQQNSAGDWNRDMAEEQWLDGWLPTHCSWWAGEDLSDKSLREEGKWPHFPRHPRKVAASPSGWLVWPLMAGHQCFRSPGAPCVYSLTPSSSVLSSNKNCCCSSVCFISV